MERHYERMMDVLMLCLPPFLVFCLAIMEWVHYFFKSPPSPWIPTIAFPIFTVIALVKGRRMWRELENSGLGVKGERIVGRMLETLRANGYDVFHDIPGEGYNIDHILIGPGGVFAVETKTHSKPLSGRASVIFDGERLTIAGHTPDRDPIVQALAGARSVRNILHQQTGREVQTKPVVLFPGWWVEKTCRDAPVTVMNEKQFVKWMTDRGTILTKDDVAFLSQGMTRYLHDKRR